MSISNFPPGTLVRFKKPYEIDYCSRKKFHPNEVFTVVYGITAHDGDPSVVHVHLDNVWFVDPWMGVDVGEEHRNFDPELFEVVHDVEPED